MSKQKQGSTTAKKQEGGRRKGRSNGEYNTSESAYSADDGLNGQSMLKLLPRPARPDMRTPEQRVKEFLEWAESHDAVLEGLPEEALRRESIY